MIKAAIFDMDGLLIDSEPFWRSSHIQALAKHGTTITHDDVRKMAGRRTDEVVQHWQQTHDLHHIPAQELEDDVVASVISSVIDHGKELPGVFHVLELCKANSLPMAVASSSAQSVIDIVLQTLGLEDYFAFSYSAKNEEFGKPHPGVFLTTAQKLGVDPSDCVVFEDALMGIRAAKAAGMHCIAVPEAANAAVPEFSELADLVLPSLNEVTWQIITDLDA